MSAQTSIVHVSKHSTLLKHRSCIQTDQLSPIGVKLLTVDDLRLTLDESRLAFPSKRMPSPFKSALFGSLDLLDLK